MIIQSKNFNTRQELENYIKAEIGTDIETNKNSDHLIKGKRDHLAELRLSDTTKVYGIDIEVTDKPTKDNPGKKMSELRGNRK